MAAESAGATRIDAIALAPPLTDNPSLDVLPLTRYSISLPGGLILGGCSFISPFHLVTAQSGIGFYSPAAGTEGQAEIIRAAPAIAGGIHEASRLFALPQSQLGRDVVVYDTEAKHAWIRAGVKDSLPGVQFWFDEHLSSANDTTLKLIAIHEAAHTVNLHRPGHDFISSAELGRFFHRLISSQPKRDRLEDFAAGPEREFLRLYPGKQHGEFQDRRPFLDQSRRVILFAYRLN